MKTINIQDGWAGVTLEQFIEISSLDPKDKNHTVNVISILSDVDSEEVKKYDTSSFNRIVEHLKWSNELPDEAKFKNILKIGEQEYGLINKFSELSLGEWIDIDEYLKDYPNNIHKVLAIIYRPLITALNDDYRIIEDYDSGGLDQRSSEFLKLSVEDVYGASVFFCLIGNLCTRNLSTYLEKEIMKMERKRMGWIPRNLGAGSRIYTAWQRGILRNLNQLQN